MKRVVRVYGRTSVVAIVLLAVLLVVVGWLSFRTARALRDDARWVAHTLEVLDGLANVRSEINRAEAMQRSFVITAQEGYRAELAAALARASAELDGLETRLVDNPRQLVRVPSMRERMRELGGLLEVAMNKRLEGGLEAAIAVVEGGATRGRIDAALGELATMEAEERSLLAQRRKDSERAFVVAAITGPLGALAALACLAAFVQLLRRQLADQAAAASAIHEQRERLHATLFSIGDAVIATDAEGRVDTMNPVAEALTGWNQEDAFARSLEDVMPIVNEETRARVENPIRRVIAEGRIVGLANHTVLLARDGVERPIEDSAAPIRDRDGRTLGVVLVFRDVTESRRADVELRASVEHARLIARAANDVIRVWDVATGAVAWNENVGMLFGYRPEEIGDDVEWWLARIHAEDRARIEQGIRDVIDGGDETWRDEYRFERADGSFAFVHDRGYVLRVDGRAVRMIGSMLDLTERRRSERELKDARTRLDAALAAGAIGTWMWDVGADRLYADRTVAQLLSVNTEDTGVSSLAAFIGAIHPEDRERVAATIQRTLEEGDTYEARYRVVQPDGDVRWIASRGSVERDPARHPTVVSGVVVDVTEMKRAEEREQHLARELALANAKFRAFFEQSLFFGGITTLDGVLVDVNRSALERCGYSAEQVLGRPFAETEWWRGQRESQARIRAAIPGVAAGGSYRAELSYVVADGAVRTVDFGLTPMRDDAGAVIFLVPTGLDITDRKQAEEALRDSEERFRGMADNLPQLAWMARADGLIVWFNRRWYEYTGTNESQMADSGWQAVHDPAELPRVLETLQRAFESGEPWEATFPLRGADGKFRPHLSRMVPVRDEAGRIVRWFGTNTDITDRLLLEDELRRVASDLSESSRRKDEFLATLAHELRNPLAPVRNALEVMRRASDDPALVERARDTMARQVAQMVRLIDDLLDISRITRGKLELKREEVSLAAVVEGAVETSRPWIDADRHVLSIELPGEPVYLDADPMRVSQILLNLLNNSAKYTESGGRIELVARREGDHVEFVVRDNGVGIAAEMLPRIFDMFTQADQPLERSHGGLGIGLALARRLVDLHGGTIVARSAGVGRGSEFVVTLPCLAHRLATRPRPDAPKAAAAVMRRRVLVVDDNVDAADSLAILLRLQGHDVRMAHDGLEALQVAESFRPEVVVLDIGLPKLNGYEVARALRAEPWGREPVLIAVTGWGHETDRRRSAEAGFDHHLVKPVDPAALHELITAHRGAR